MLVSIKKTCCFLNPYFIESGNKSEHQQQVHGHPDIFHRFFNVFPASYKEKTKK